MSTITVLSLSRTKVDQMIGYLETVIGRVGSPDVARLSNNLALSGRANRYDATSAANDAFIDYNRMV